MTATRRRSPLPSLVVALVLVSSMLAVASPAHALTATECVGTPRLWRDTSNKVHANYTVRCGRKVIRARVNGYLSRNSPRATVGLTSDRIRANPNYPNGGFQLADVGNSLSNPRGTQRFCAEMTYGWLVVGASPDATKRVCAYY